MDYAIAELKKQAAKLGANGVLIGSSGDTSSVTSDGHGNVYPVVGKTIQGRAIFVKSQ